MDETQTTASSQTAAASIDPGSSRKSLTNAEESK
jgi:hypothetical protein